MKHIFLWENSLNLIVTLNPYGNSWLSYSLLYILILGWQLKLFLRCRIMNWSFWLRIIFAILFINGWRLGRWVCDDECTCMTIPYLEQYVDCSIISDATTIIHTSDVLILYNMFVFPFIFLFFPNAILEVNCHSTITFSSLERRRFKALPQRALEKVEAHFLPHVLFL